MEFRDKETKIINFIEDFGCITESQLDKLFECDKNTIRNILHTHFINKKGDIFVHKQKKNNKKVCELACIKHYRLFAIGRGEL